MLKYLGENLSRSPREKISDRKTRKVIILLGVWIFLFWICIGLAIWDRGYFLTSLAFTDPPRWKPSVNDIVGKWQLSDDSIKQMQDSGTQIPFHEIEFRADGTFKAINFPRLIEWSEERIVLNFYTGTGTWSFDKMRFKPWAIQLYYDKVEDGLWRSDYYLFRGIEPPFEMYDGGIMVLERK